MFKVPSPVPRHRRSLSLQEMALTAKLSPYHPSVMINFPIQHHPVHCAPTTAQPQYTQINQNITL